MLSDRMVRDCWRFDFNHSYTCRVIKGAGSDPSSEYNFFGLYLFEGPRSSRFSRRPGTAAELAASKERMEPSPFGLVAGLAMRQRMGSGICKEFR
jgi:hypothetical protein